MGQAAESGRRAEGDAAVRLAHELQARIARERRTVQALKEHVVAAADDDLPQEPERLQAPTRSAPVLSADDGTWVALGECLSVRSRSADGHLVVQLAGEVDLSGALRLRAHLTDALGAGTRELCLDLSQVSFMDSNGLSALLWARRQAMAQEIAFSIAPQVHPHVQRLLHVTRLEAVLLTGSSGG